MSLWKRRRSQPRHLPTEYPAGVFLKTENGTYYVQSPNKRFRFSTDRVLASWSPQRIIDASEGDPAVSRMKISAKMKFRNGSLLYCHANGKMYLISENKRRRIDNPYWLEYLNTSLNEAVWVSVAEIDLHEEGAPLT